MTVFGRRLVASALLAFGAFATVQAEEPALPPLEEQVVEPAASLQALGQVQDYMDSVKSLQADFVQHAPNGGVTRGTMYLMRPGYVRFDYADDVPFLVVADGKSVNFIDYEIGQVTKWPVKDTPLRALLGGSVDLASIGAHIEVAPAGIEDMIALSARDVDKPEMGEITLYFDGAKDGTAPLRLTSWAVTDAEGGMTYVELSNQQANVELADSLWTFKDPRGLARRRQVR